MEYDLWARRSVGNYASDTGSTHIQQKYPFRKLKIAFFARSITTIPINFFSTMARLIARFENGDPEFQEAVLDIVLREEKKRRCRNCLRIVGVRKDRKECDCDIAKTDRKDATTILVGLAEHLTPAQKARLRQMQAENKKVAERRAQLPARTVVYDIKRREVLRDRFFDRNYNDGEDEEDSNDDDVNGSDNDEEPEDPNNLDDSWDPDAEPESEVEPNDDEGDEDDDADDDDDDGYDDADDDYVDDAGSGPSAGAGADNNHKSIASRTRSKKHSYGEESEPGSSADDDHEFVASRTRSKKHPRDEDDDKDFSASKRQKKE
jgi:hypothetical protein